MTQPTHVIPIVIEPPWFIIFDTEFFNDRGRLLQLTRTGSDIIYVPSNGRRKLKDKLVVLDTGLMLKYLDIIVIGVDGAAGLIRDGVVTAEMLAKSSVEATGAILIPGAVSFKDKQYDLRISPGADSEHEVSDFVYLCRQEDGSEVAFELGH